MLSSVTDNIMHIYLNKMVFNLTKSKNKPLIPANLKWHLEESIAIPLWTYRGQETELPSLFRISHAPSDFCDSLCEDKAVLQMTKFSLLTWWADFTPLFEFPLQHEESLPSQMCRWHGGQREIGLAVGSLAACTLRVSPVLATLLAGWTHLGHATREQQDR